MSAESLLQSAQVELDVADACNALPKPDDTVATEQTVTAMECNEVDAPEFDPLTPLLGSYDNMPLPTALAVAASHFRPKKKKRKQKQPSVRVSFCLS